MLVDQGLDSDDRFDLGLLVASFFFKGINLFFQSLCPVAEIFQ
jgi:hypothetical protein